MSEQINNREFRKEKLKQIIKDLHSGKDFNEVKKVFEESFKNVSASEISEVEKALIAEGLPVAEIQRLCDVHAAVFKGSIEEIHAPKDIGEIPGHPANILKQENRFIERLIERQIKPFLAGEDISAKDLKSAVDELKKIDLHYSRKENIFFPYMEKYGITAPPKVMWGVDDEIRVGIKQISSLLSEENIDTQGLKEKLQGVITKILDMIFKEENIMVPMLSDVLSEDDWKKIAQDSKEIGYLIDRVPSWNPSEKNKEVIQKEVGEPGVIVLPSGVFKLSELTAMLNTLPFDITFVDKDDTVKFFSESKERIFTRTKAIIGRKVTNCHPPASVHVVEGIVRDLKSGKKDHEDFWINMGGKMVYIRYFAVRDEKGEYLGVVEVTQDIKPIKDITGEKRLVSD